MRNGSEVREPLRWPAEGVARVPYPVFYDPDIYAREQEIVFRGPVWNFLGLEAQLPEPGCFIAVEVGNVPVVVVRDESGEIQAMVNRCSHKGTQLVYEPSGKARRFMCIYHNWCFNLHGDLTSVAFERGIRGKGGMDAGFRKEDHGLIRLRVHRESGLIFGTFSDEAPDFESYVGPEILANIRRVFDRPVEVYGQYSQMLYSNWKPYIENVADPYHATILHPFNGVMKMDRLTMEGGIIMGPKGWHYISYSRMTTDSGGEIYQTSQIRNADLLAYGYGLRDPSLTEYWHDHDDTITLTITTIFPTFIIQQMRNSLAVRTVVPRGPRQSELMWTLFGYADDDEHRRATRLKHTNMVGPAGLVSMEDACVVGLLQRGIEGADDGTSVLEMGGRGIEPIPGSRTSEGSVRGFWAGYRELMGL